MMAGSQIVTLWEAVFECEYDTVVHEFRGFFERCRSRDIPVEAFGFLARPHCFSWIEAEEMDGGDNVSFLLRYREDRLKEDGVRTRTLGGLQVSRYSSRQTVVSLKAAVDGNTPNYTLHHTVKIGWRLEREAAGVGVRVRRSLLSLDREREYMLQAHGDDVLRVINRFNCEHSGFGYWISVPKDMGDKKHFFGIILKGRGGQYYSSESFLQANNRWEAGIVEGVQAGKALKLNVSFGDLLERPRFWQYLGNLCREFEAFGFFPKAVDTTYEQHVEDIDSFSSAGSVSFSDVADLIPLDWYEQDVQEAFEDIIGEPFSQKDWGGELNDLYTSRLIMHGRPVTAAFMLKGKGTPGPLTIRKCGKNGDQIARLFLVKVDLYVVQHVDAIAQAVRGEMRDKVELENHRGHQCSMCVLDGYDVARILKAYGKL